MPKLILNLTSVADGPSALVDEVVCPAVREFAPCVDDARCRQQLSKGVASASLISCVEACRRRPSTDAWKTGAAASDALDGQTNGAASPRAEDRGDGELLDDGGGVDTHNHHHHGIGGARSDDGELVVPAVAPTVAATSTSGAPGGHSSSWDAVRARYRERQQSSGAPAVRGDANSLAGADATGRLLPTAGGGGDEDGPPVHEGVHGVLHGEARLRGVSAGGRPPSRSPAETGEQQQQHVPPGRRRKMNQYGDEILEDE